MHDHSTRTGTHAQNKEVIARLHEFDQWPGRWIWPMVGASLALSGAASLAYYNCWPLLLAAWPAIGAIDFVLVLAFHDASHGRLHPVHWINEAYGHLMGTVMWTPLNVYRYAHARHHAQLGRPGDPELWPYNSPRIARPLRVLSAFIEILFGAVYPPLLFLRSVLVGHPTPRERKLIVLGYALCTGFWTMSIAITALFGLWPILIVTLVVPMFIAGMLQTLNKFEQHLGLHGQTVLGLTRTVVDRHGFGEVVSAAMLYNDYHGTHHRYAKIPYYYLPYATPYALAGATEPCPVFPSIFSAIVDMICCLSDPKVGPQWIKQKAPNAHASSIPQPVFTGVYNT